MSAPAPAFYVAEPPAAFSVRPPIVVDCSALSAILFDEPARDEALARLVGRSLHAPNLLDHEIVSVALKKGRKDGPAEAFAQALRDYAASDIDLHPVDLIAQYELATRYGLSAYDAAYLWLAAELRAPLATFDRGLAEAAQAHLGTLS
ncbi:VapC toxin family PIN domain ribonuclease [Variovorax sp. WS11]|uniref:type II toxin-antitoxin system VapC family toxin n=1 Tax=Variovorax sp. WS11 TaxID=1105204 RepID=UPI000D0D6B20|nr:type II toxin-antitoxin system VapC family toxin [Variovorax sp. WS11]NDZ14067.1 type II toxin-antitoxin system VapC family toxin [Variovorax sp. WS11]PSL81026.1 VapC toxin family PIN domain ribonuclease [Variovorax sp. WS11]